MDLPLRPIANRFCGCFCLGSGPVFWVLLVFWLFASLFPLAKRKSGWGICGSSLFVWLWFSFCCFNRFADSKDFLSLYRVLSAYSHVRTEPLARHRPHSRKKKWFVLLFFLCGLFAFVFVVFCFVSWMSVTVHRTTYRSSTCLLLRPLQQRPLRDLINQLIPTATCS